jgi:alpha-ketoglutarate-dependent taurine dioxygenase
LSGVAPIRTLSVVGQLLFRVEPLDATFGAVVREIELRALDDDTWAALYDTWLQYALLIFPDQFLTRPEQDEFARRFGDLEFPASPIANVDADGTLHSAPDDDRVKGLRGNEGWHHDSTYMPVQAKGAVFTAEIVPADGAATGFADMRAAYDALDEETRRRLEGLCAYHSLTYSQGRAGYLPSKRSAKGGYEGYGYHDGEDPLRPLVKIHPETGRPNLLIGRHAYGVVGMDPEESERFLDGLTEQACRRPRTYHHQWTVGDAVVWDNRRLMHQATPFDMSQPRRMWHTRIAGARPFELATNYT